MPRQIKFRVWDGESYLPSSDGLSFKPKFLLKGGWGVHGFLQRPDMGFVIQQFTGLLDKNNKEIYEGDIVSFDGRNYPITWERARWSCPGDCSGECDLDDLAYLVSVIGNIFENPELLI